MYIEEHGEICQRPQQPAVLSLATASATAHDINLSMPDQLYIDAEQVSSRSWQKRGKWRHRYGRCADYILRDRGRTCLHVCIILYPIMASPRPAASSSANGQTQKAPGGSVSPRERTRKRKVYYKNYSGAASGGTATGIIYDIVPQQRRARPLDHLQPTMIVAALQIRNITKRPRQKCGVVVKTVSVPAVMSTAGQFPWHILKPYDRIKKSNKSEMIR